MGESWRIWAEAKPQPLLCPLSCQTTVNSVWKAFDFICKLFGLSNFWLISSHSFLTRCKFVHLVGTRGFSAWHSLEDPSVTQQEAPPHRFPLHWTSNWNESWNWNALNWTVMLCNAEDCRVLLFVTMLCNEKRQCSVKEAADLQWDSCNALCMCSMVNCITMHCNAIHERCSVKKHR